MKPLAIDLFCGLGGWTEGLLAEGYRVIGFDIERHQYGEHRYPSQLVIQDVLTLHGAQFKTAALIVASPPCQAYSYRAMPWKRAKALGPPDNALFEACFRIQREASAAAGHHIPIVVENVRGAQKWVGRARWHFGSFYLWGDVPALMPLTRRGSKVSGTGSWFYAADNPEAFCWRKNGYIPPGMRSAEQDSILTGDGLALMECAGGLGLKHGGDCFNDPSWPGKQGGVKHHGSGPVWFDSGPASVSSRSVTRKAASAQIAKIPFVLAQHIAAVYHPE